MKQSNSYFWAGLVLILLIAGAAWIRLAPKIHGIDSLRASRSFAGPSSNNPNNKGQEGSGDDSSLPAIVPRNAPVVTGFVGDLQVKGNLQTDGTLEPFVVGETLKLEAEALNAVEYRWTVNGAVLQEKGQDWSPRRERFFDVIQPGMHTFTVQVRGAEKDLVSQEKGVGLNIFALKIMRLSKSIVHEDDEHFVTGDTLNLEVEMASSMKADLDFYQYRYIVNDAPIKHPDDGEEWTTNDTLAYVFAAPGNYSFKVEARRTGEKKVEDSMELPETVVAADAVLLSFDSSPSNEKGAPVGSQVNFSGFPTSRYGKSECRIGVKKINAADFNWLNEDNGSQWGDPYRTWVPVEPGTFVVRCEIRETGKALADDFREMVFTVTDGNF